MATLTERVESLTVTVAKRHKLTQAQANRIHKDVLALVQDAYIIGSNASDEVTRHSFHLVPKKYN